MKTLSLKKALELAAKRLHQSPKWILDIYRQNEAIERLRRKLEQ